MSFWGLSGDKPPCKGPKPSEPLWVALQQNLLQLVITSANFRLAFFSECFPIRNNLPFAPLGPWGHLGLFRSHFEWKAISNGRLLRMERHSETKANLEFAEVTTNCSNFYCKASCKGSEGFGPLKGGLASESLKATFWRYWTFKGRFGSRKP